MRRLIAVIAAFAIIGVVTGCSAYTTPATNITPTQAQLNASATCDPGEYGWWWFRVRSNDWPTSFPWQYEKNPHGFDCRPGATMKPGTFPASTTMGDLGPKVDGSPATYRVQLCGGLGYPVAPYGEDAYVNPVTGVHSATAIVGCWNKNNQFVADNNGQYTADQGDTTFVTAPFVGSGSGSTWTTSTDTPDPEGVPVNVTDTGCFGDLACQSGAGTKYYCGYIPQSWISVAVAGLKAFKGSMGPTHMCWGTGKNRGTYKNVDQPLTQGSISTWGEYDGWRYDGVTAMKGPYTENGKEKWYRMLQFHACAPQKGPCLATVAKTQLQFWATVWVDSNNVAHAVLKHNQINS